MKLEEAADLLQEATTALTPVFDAVERDYLEMPKEAQNHADAVKHTARVMEQYLKATLKAVNDCLEEETPGTNLALE